MALDDNKKRQEIEYIHTCIRELKKEAKTVPHLLSTYDKVISVLAAICTVLYTL
jgi:hypothetical protein